MANSYWILCPCMCVCECVNVQSFYFFFEINNCKSERNVNEKKFLFMLFEWNFIWCLVFAAASTNKSHKRAKDINVIHLFGCFHFVSVVIGRNLLNWIFFLRLNRFEPFKIAHRKKSNKHLYFFKTFFAIFSRTDSMFD